MKFCMQKKRMKPFQWRIWRPFSPIQILKVKFPLNINLLLQRRNMQNYRKGRITKQFISYIRWEFYIYRKSENIITQHLTYIVTKRLPFKNFISVITISYRIRVTTIVTFFLILLVIFYMCGYNFRCDLVKPFKIYIQKDG